MQSADGHDANNAASAHTDVELIEEETNFANEVLDGELEAAASGPTVTSLYRLFSLFVDFADTAPREDRGASVLAQCSRILARGV